MDNSVHGLESGLRGTVRPGIASQGQRCRVQIMRFSGILGPCSFCMMCASGRPFRLMEKARGQGKRASVLMLRRVRASPSPKMLWGFRRAISSRTLELAANVFFGLAAWYARVFLSLLFLYAADRLPPAQRERKRKWERERKGNFLCVC